MTTLRSTVAVGRSSAAGWGDSGGQQQPFAELSVFSVQPLPHHPLTPSPPHLTLSKVVLLTPACCCRDAVVFAAACLAAEVSNAWQSAARQQQGLRRLWAPRRRRSQDLSEALLAVVPDGGGSDNDDDKYPTGIPVLDSLLDSLQIMSKDGSDRFFLNPPCCWWVQESGGGAHL